jgi:chemotaxis signal transduction protein
MMNELPEVLDVNPNANPVGEIGGQRQGSLQQFQTRVTARINQAQLGEQQDVALLSVYVQGFRLLVSMAQVNELIPMVTLTALPLSKPWVQGLAVVRSEVVTVFDLAFCLNRLLQVESFNAQRSPLTDEKIRFSDAKLVVLNKAVGHQLAFSCDRLLGTVLPLQSGLTLIEPDAHVTGLPWPHAPDSIYVKHFWRDKNGMLFIELSLSALLKSPDFISLSH